jgi:hypothetical protein
MSRSQTLTNVVYLPEATTNLLSIKAAAEKGATFIVDHTSRVQADRPYELGEQLHHQGHCGELLEFRSCTVGRAL